MSFKIEGWFPPIVYTSHLDGVKYAICDGKWVVIPNEMTLEEVTAGWVCIANNTPKAPIYPKKVTKKQLLDNFTEKFKPVKNKVSKPTKTLQPLLFAEPVKKIKKLII
jgi:hypothetical protein